MPPKNPKGSKTRVTKPKTKRSRNGCLSCKKLKIKCSEDKPFCEYCADTGRPCVYPSTESDSGSRISSELVPEALFTPYPLQKVQATRDLGLQVLVNSSARQLGVSNFEFRLLHFFQVFCVPLFSFGKNAPVERVWRNEVPKLWQSSKLVRLSIYLFACLNMWPLCNYSELLDPSKPMSQLSVFETGGPGIIDKVHHTKVEGDIESEGENLYEVTANYFQRSLRITLDTTGSVIHNLIQKDEIENTPHSIHRRSELVISGILIFSFLGLHPHKVVPLVCFDGSSATDFLSLCVDIKQVMATSHAHLESTSMRALFATTRDLQRHLPSTEAAYPIIDRFKEDMERWIIENSYDKVIDSKISEEIEVIKDELHLLHFCLYRAARANYPIPIFRWLLFSERKFERMVREKRPMPLKLLYIFSCLNLLCRFSLFRHKNVWIEFIMWYKEHVFLQHGGWKDKSDELWYNIAVVEQCEVRFNLFEGLASFDPLNPDMDMFQVSSDF